MQPNVSLPNLPPTHWKAEMHFYAPQCKHKVHTMKHNANTMYDKVKVVKCKAHQTNLLSSKLHFCVSSFSKKMNWSVKKCSTVFHKTLWWIALHYVQLWMCTEAFLLKTTVCGIFQGLGLFRKSLDTISRSMKRKWLGSSYIYKLASQETMLGSNKTLSIHTQGCVAKNRRVLL